MSLRATYRTDMGVGVIPFENQLELRPNYLVQRKTGQQKSNLTSVFRHDNSDQSGSSSFPDESFIRGLSLGGSLEGEPASQQRFGFKDGENMLNRKRRLQRRPATNSRDRLFCFRWQL